jgi:hypothetical protein
VVGTLVLVQVARLPRGERRREEARASPAVAVVARAGGDGAGDLGLLWRSYVRRFDLEHTFRFLKSRRSGGRARGCATPSKPTGGRG